MLAPLIELYDSLSPIIIVIVSIGWWRSASRNRVGEGQPNLHRSPDLSEPSEFASFWREYP